MTALNEPKGRIRRGNERKILKAAEKIFATTGFAGATMSDIAAEARLPKANLHYYFGTKEDLYRAVLDDILGQWLSPVEGISADADPADAVRRYVVAKMEASRTRPYASKVFANEVLHGAAVLRTFLSTELKDIVDRTAEVVDGWIARGLVAPVDPRHFLFMIWAITQHYADFDLQVRSVLGKSALTRADWDDATGQVVAFVLRAFGLPVPPADGAGRLSGSTPAHGA